MKLLRVLAAAAMAVSFAPVTAQAQGIPKTVPAEFPPGSYDGRQYVDSNGCVFIRAGVDGAVTWVPRMTRGRKQICGLQPTLSASARAVATAPRATAPSPAPQVVRAPAPQRPAQAAATSSYRSAPKPVAAPPVPAAPRVVSAPRTTVRSTSARPTQTVGTCDRGNPVSTRYINSSSRHAIRCGPQTSAHVTQKVGGTQYRSAAPAGLVAPMAPGTPVSPDTIYRKYEHNGVIYYQSAGVRVAPRHVYENQLAAREGLHVPPGYSPIWEDDRLNPYRAHQTFAGKAQMEQTWTRRLPMELQPRSAGPTVTAQTVQTAPGYARGYHGPYVGQASNSAAGGVVTRAAQSPVAQEAPEARQARKASHRYVQLGAFTDPAHARETAQKIANSGYPARLGTHKRDGAVYTLVLTGPYDTQSGLESGMAFVRGMGFDQATLRR